jgi:hypothetical protein
MGTSWSRDPLGFWQINREGMLAKLMGYGLSHNSHLGDVLSPFIVNESSVNGKAGAICIMPNPATRFFTGNVQQWLYIFLGLAKRLGFDLDRDMKTPLYLVRRLERWMEFVLPHHGGNGKDRGCSARDLTKTSAPQAFRLSSIQESIQFLRLDLFGERHQATAEDQLIRSGLVSRL